MIRCKSILRPALTAVLVATFFVFTPYHVAQAQRPSLSGMDAKLDRLLLGQTRMENQHQTIINKLDSLAMAGGLVPFKVETRGGVCNTALVNSANPLILIDSNGSDPFVVTSILIKTGPQGPGAQGYEFLSVNNVIIDGTRFDTVTGNLTDAFIGGSAISESADLMGTPIRRTSVSVDAEKGGNFPHQIVADGANSNDIRIQLFCRADDFDLNIATVLVAGWKPASDAVTVTYVPGN